MDVSQCQLQERPVRARFFFGPLAAPACGYRARTEPVQGSTWLMWTQCGLRREGGQENCIQELSVSTTDLSDAVTPHGDKKCSLGKRENIARNQVCDFQVAFLRV